MSKQDELTEKLTNHVAKYGKKPSVIITTKSDYEKFMNELTKATVIDYSKVLNPKYMGIKIVRSDDVKEIEVY